MLCLHLELSCLRAANERRLKQCALQDRHLAAIRAELHVAKGSIHTRLNDLKRRLDADPDALEGYSPTYIREVLNVNERAGLRFWDALIRAEARVAVEQVIDCGICFTHPNQDTAMNCGHMFCGNCAAKVVVCPMCKTVVISRNYVFL